VEKVCFESGMKEKKDDRRVTVVTLMNTVILHDQGSVTVRQRLRDVDEARGMIQEVGSRGRV